MMNTVTCNRATPYPPPIESVTMTLDLDMARYIAALMGASTRDAKEALGVDDKKSYELFDALVAVVGTYPMGIYIEPYDAQEF